MDDLASGLNDRVLLIIPIGINQSGPQRKGRIGSRMPLVSPQARMRIERMEQ